MSKKQKPADYDRPEQKRDATRLNKALSAQRLKFIKLGAKESDIHRIEEAICRRELPRKRSVLAEAERWVKAASTPQNARGVRGAVGRTTGRPAKPPRKQVAVPARIARRADLDEQNRRAERFFRERDERQSWQTKMALQKYLDGKKSATRASKPKKFCRQCDTPVLDWEDFCAVHVPR